MGGARYARLDKGWALLILAGTYPVRCTVRANSAGADRMSAYK